MWRAAGLGALLTRGNEGWRRPPASCPSRAGSTSRCPSPSRAEDDPAIPFLTAAGSAIGAGTTPRAWWRSETRLSPVYADLAGLPPLYLPAGQYDTLRKDTEALARAATAAGVAVTAESWPGMVHGWQGLVSAGVPEAAAAFARAHAYLDDLGA